MQYTITRRYTLFGLLTACLLGIELVIARTTAFSTYPLPLGIGILFDCTVLPSALFYGLVARPLRLPISRTVLVAIVAWRVALVILPSTPPSLTAFWPVLVGLAEGTLLVVSVLRFRQIRQTYSALRVTQDVQTALNESFAAVFGEKVARIIVSEGQVVYYALFGWRQSVEVPAGATPITTHRESGQLALLVALLCVALIEAAAIHFLLATSWPTVAYGVTVASLYGCLLLLAIINTIRKRPSFLTETALHLRLDLRWQAVILRSAIASIQPISDKPAKRPGLLNTALATTPNVLVTLHKPCQLTGIYGLSRTVMQLSLFVDNRQEFIKL